MSTTFFAIVLILLLQLKHFLGDFVFQNPYILANRGTYGHPGGLLHAGIHMAGSLIVLGAVGVPLGLLAALVLAEGVVHYHIDWSKDNIGLKLNLGTTDKLYWIAMGADQALHQATYLAMVAALACYGAL